MLAWFLRQRRRDKIAVGLFVLALMPVVWTVIASWFFVLLLGVKARQYFPWSDPDTYWQWWAFFLDPDQPRRIQLFLKIAAGAAALPIGAFVVRLVMDHVGSGKRPSLYGKTGWASRKQMASRDIKHRRDLY